MAKQTPDELKKLVGHLFESQRLMLPLWQTISEHFYPERADFTITRNVGTELADSLVDSYPVLVRRDLANSFTAMLRDGKWFDIGIDGNPGHDGNLWLDSSTTRLMKLFYDRSANFVRATKEGDHDYATFGQTVISIELNRKASGLLFRSWHLRDCAWWEDETGQVCGLARKWKPTYRELVDYFGESRIHPNIIKKLYTKPFEKADVYHICMPVEMYRDADMQERYTYVSIFIDITNNHIIEEVGMNYFMYVVPRFQTISGSQYAYSPATVAGLPDARTLQAMTYTLLEAGERYARPPIIATQKVIRSDVDLSPDGITWVDDEYDEKLGAALRTLPQDRGGFPIGMQLRTDVMDVLASAFYINKLSLPDISREMTAYEVSERMKQYRRENLPLFAPIEAEYNGRLCEVAFEVAMNAGMLGSQYDIPQSLRSKEVDFKFRSPLSQSEEEKRANQFDQVSRMLAQAAQVDPGAIHNVDIDTAFRDAVLGIDSPTRWLRSVEEVMQRREGDAMQQAAMAAMQAVPQAQEA